MHNVVPFPRELSTRPHDLGGNLRRAILLLDISLDQTAQIIDACPLSHTKQDLKNRMLELKTQLDLLRVMARTLVAVSDEGNQTSSSAVETFR